MPRAIEKLTRRDVLRRSLAAGAAAALPWFVPAAARGAEAGAAPSERITLGVIGIGPRATYDLGGMLKQPDCQCVAVCDVQASRRDAGKEARRQALREPRLRALPRLPRAAGAARHRRRADRHRRPLARPGLDPRGEGRQGRLQREAVRPDDRALPGPGRRDPEDRPRLPGRHAAAERGELPGRRATRPAAASSASSRPSSPRSTRRRSRRPGFRASPPRRATWSTGTCGSDRPPGVPTTIVMSKDSGADTGISTPARGCSTGERTRSISASGPTGPTTPGPWNTKRRARRSTPAMPTA